jgi:cell division protein FtsL
MSGNRKVKSPLLTGRTLLAGILLMLVLLAEVFFDTWCAVQCRRTGYEIVEAGRQQEELLETRRKLQIEMVHLKSPQVLGARAKTELGMITPKPEQIVRVP